MIWPEFEDKEGNVIPENDKSICQSGTARMWVINTKARAYHIDKIKLGLKYYFMEGSRKVAECNIIEILGLPENPKE